jgi:VIT1/CCC1 family predicted Fe2+/Mn2+ transporter
VTYREADPERVKELERERAVAEEQRQKEHADDLATIEKMRNPFHRLAPGGLARRALALSASAIGLPFLITLVAFALGPTAIDVLFWVVLACGVVPGALGALFGIGALISPPRARLAGVVAVLLGLFGVVWTLACAFMLAMSHIMKSHW